MVTPEIAGLEQRLGWRRANDHDAVAFSEIRGMALGLYGRKALADEAQLPGDGSGLGAVTLACNVRARDEVDATLDEAEAARILKLAKELFRGSYSGFFRRGRPPGRSPGTPIGRSRMAAASAVSDNPCCT